MFDSMSERDRNNLMFIMTCPRNEIQTWFDTLSQDDQLYALELLDQASFIITARTDDEIEDFTLANKVLDKFRL